ncbi:MAG: histone deacetylase family protein [Spirulinaceae cyanobacterium]
MTFATYLHPQIFSTIKPLPEIKFSGYSLPHYNQVRQALVEALPNYPQLPLYKAHSRDYFRVHSRIYLQKLAAQALGKTLDNQAKKLPQCSRECQGLEYSLPGYLYGLGGMITAINAMRQGELERAYCFSMVGHHAHQTWGHGYCLLNPLAAAVRYAQTQGFHKVLIIDWDIHHGDGTQSIFSGDRSVYCVSIHNAVDIYMAKASSLQVGTTTVAEVVGHCNIPIIPDNFPVEVLAEEGITGDFYYGKESLTRFNQALENLPWQPNLITIFSGYDSHREDCGEATTNWTNNDFCQLTEMIVELARKYNCPILSTHGGGYNLPITVSAAIAHINTLATA